MMDGCFFSFILATDDDEIIGNKNRRITLKHTII
jgi:hypothetical protein